MGAGGSAGATGGSGGTSGTGSTGDSGTGDSGSIPTTCAQADYAFGCCLDNVNYYCPGTTTILVAKMCPAGTVCGWYAPKNYYFCVAPPGGPDPSGTHPMACE
jgi:hypothetical protein